MNGGNCCTSQYDELLLALLSVTSFHSFGEPLGLNRMEPFLSMRVHVYKILGCLYVRFLLSVTFFVFLFLIVQWLIGDNIDSMLTALTWSQKPAQM